MVRGSNCELLTPTRGSGCIVTCLAIHSPNYYWGWDRDKHFLQK